MLIALALFNFVHPGKVMPGKGSDFPSRKERKNVVSSRNAGRNMTVLPTHEPKADATSPASSR